MLCHTSKAVNCPQWWNAAWLGRGGEAQRNPVQCIALFGILFQRSNQRLQDEQRQSILSARTLERELVALKADLAETTVARLTRESLFTNRRNEPLE